MVELHQSRITRVNLSKNEISSFKNFTGHNNILYLELKGNKLKDCVGICNMAKLQELYLNENEITSLKELKNLPSLKRLEVNTNKLETLDDLPELPALERFDVGGNQIEKSTELKKLGTLLCLKHIVLAGCPFADEKGDDLKKEVLIMLDHLSIKMVNEDEITEEDITTAKEEKEERLKQIKEAEEEAARLAAEKLAEGAEGQAAEEEAE